MYEYLVYNPRDGLLRLLKKLVQIIAEKFVNSKIHNFDVY